MKGFIVMAPYSSLLILFFCWEFLRETNGSNHVFITTNYGKLKGFTRDFNQSIGLGNISRVNIFLGVPYASPPTGDLRFRPPVKPKPWKGVYDATKFKSVCYQDPTYNTMFWARNESWPQSDDCLYINIYAPNISRSVSYPVLVYIHGGGYEAGSPVISPGDILPLWDVVLVTIQYRLGPFGFLSTGDSAAPGNYGMLDQIEVLKWIKDNIGVFKGDPSKVTIFGESAGGSSVGLLLLSPLSKGLFHNAIALSGVDLSPFAVNSHDEAINLARIVAKRCDCPTTDNHEMISCIRRVKNPNKIWRSKDVNFWRPVVDNVFLKDTPINLRKAKQFHPIPLIASITSEEGSFFLQNDNLTKLSYSSFKFHVIDNYEKISRSKTHSLSQSMKDAIIFQYAPWPDIHNQFKLREGLVDCVTDLGVAAPAHAALELHTTIAPGYLLVFSHRSPFTKNAPWMGVPHKADTDYQFGFPLLPLYAVQDKYNDEDRQVSKYIIRYFTNFARTGNPTPEPVAGSTWKQFNKHTPYYMNVTVNPKSHDHFHSKGIAFWNNYFPKLKRKACNGPDVLGSSSKNGATRNFIFCNVLIPVLLAFIAMIFS